MFTGEFGARSNPGHRNPAAPSSAVTGLPLPSFPNLYCVDVRLPAKTICRPVAHLREPGIAACPVNSEKAPPPAVAKENAREFSWGQIHSGHPATARNFGCRIEWEYRSWERWRPAGEFDSVRHQAMSRRDAGAPRGQTGDIAKNGDCVGRRIFRIVSGNIKNPV